MRATAVALTLAVEQGALAAEGGAANPFAGGIGNAIITLIIFSGLLYVLGKFFWPQILRVLEEREKMIRTSLETAKHEREQAEKLLARYQEQLDRARQEASAIVDEGRRDAEAVRRRIQEEARREADETLARAKREIRLATDSAVKELYDRTAELSVQIAGNIIKKELRPEDHRALVAESLERMQTSKN